MPVTTECFTVDGGQLAGVLHTPAEPATRGVLVVVGGPQYRVGSHRQFLLLARELSAAGFAVFRFDCTGMGDSDGEPRSFERIDADIRAALDTLYGAVPSLRDVVIWGLCDGAAAAALYARRDARVSGLILLNPWVRTEESLARSYVAEYYARRLLEPAFWRKLFGGQVRIVESVTAFLRTLGRALQPGRPGRAEKGRQGTPQTVDGPDPDAEGTTLPERLRSALGAFRGRTLVILSGRDLTAGEFRDVARTAEWQRVLNRPTVTQFTLEAADHTFSRRQWRDEVARRCVAWLRG